MAPTYLSFDDLVARGVVNYSRVHLWRLIKAGAFPAPVQLNPLVGPRGSRKAWLIEDIEAHEARLAKIAADKRAAA